MKKTVSREVGVATSGNKTLRAGGRKAKVTATPETVPPHTKIFATQSQYALSSISIDS